MGIHFVRPLIWLLIIASVWLAARYGDFGPDPDLAHEGMLDAARHYEAQKAKTQGDVPAPPVESR